MKEIIPSKNGMGTPTYLISLSGYISELASFDFFRLQNVPISPNSCVVKLDIGD